MSEAYYTDGDATLYRGDAFRMLCQLPDASVDAIITDPPYSSGGMVRGDRTNGVHAKYVNNDSIAGNALSEFAGDSRDSRGYLAWVTLWLGECLRIAKPGAVAALFSDWRQLPTTTDALQSAGWVWRGIVPWFKPASRPQVGRWANACEYVIWGTAGPRSLDLADVGALPGFYQASPPRERDHITQKPLEVMRALVRITPPGGVVLDPFMGSGTTGVAAVLEGRKFIGCEQVEHFAGISRERIETAVRGYRDDGLQMVLGVEAAP